MKKYILSLYQLCLFVFVLTVVSSCVKHPDSPGYEYVDDMFRSQAIEAYIDYGLVGDKVNDTLKNTISARIPVKGTIAFSKSKKTSTTNMPFYYGTSEEERIRAGEEVPLPKHYYSQESIQESNTAEGKRLYGLFCAHCHGDKGNGDGLVITAVDTLLLHLLTTHLKIENRGQFFTLLPMERMQWGHMLHNLIKMKDGKWLCTLEPCNLTEI